MSYSARVSVDNNTAEIVLELHGRSLVRLDAKSSAIANIGPRQARRIAIQLLQAADEMDDLRDAKGQ
jgi:hypothetical protein